MGCSGSNSRNQKFNIFVAVDGSEQSEYGLDTCIGRHKPNQFINILHISNDNNKKTEANNTGVQKYFDKLKINVSKKLKEEDYKFIYKEKSEINLPIIEIVHIIAMEENSNLLVVGSKGTHGEKKTKTLTKGIEYLVKNCKIPTLVMNDYETEIDFSKGKNWLFAIKNESFRSFRSLEFCFSLINKKKDYVIGLHLKDDKWPVNRIKTTFDRICSKNGIKNYEFVKQEIDINKTMTKNLLDYLFFSQKNFDIVVLNNNIRNNNIDNCLVVEMLKYGKHNILYCRESL